MNWFAWRQHRKTFLIFVVFLIAFAAFAIPTGNHFWHVYQHALSTCAQNPATPSCSDLGNSLFQGDGVVVDAVILAGFAAPILVGLFLGSPLLAREYEEGTNKLAWTQSTSRRKWLTTKLGWALVFAALYGLAITLLITWWSRTLNTLGQNRFDTSEFDIQGLMPVAYAIFFTAIGFTMGAWFRKTLVALAVTFGVFVLCMASFGQWVRPHYMAPVTVTAPMGPQELDSKVPSGAWALSRNIVDKNGRTFDSFTFNNMPASCQALIQQAQTGTPGQGIRVKVVPGSPDAIDSCLNAAGYHQVATYQPSYRYWDFQRIEAGIYLGMAALAVAATYWLVLKRDA
jgi:ABC-type transport system involved in multi-copper enzyme maturation permease subunit